MTVAGARINLLLVEFNRNPPAKAAAIAAVEAKSGLVLPSEYKEFLTHCNGGEGFIGSAYAILWRAEELLDMNKTYHVQEYSPDIFIFGSDGGGEAFAFDLRSKAKPIVSVPFLGMQLTDARPLGENFNGFLEELFKS